jgi:hypothetical protein
MVLDRDFPEQPHWVNFFSDLLSIVCYRRWWLCEPTKGLWRVDLSCHARWRLAPQIAAMMAFFIRID